MIEKVNPKHPDKIADRIAGALVDYCYTKEDNPKCAFEVLIGHGNCYIIAETSVHIPSSKVVKIVKRIAGELVIDYRENDQDIELGLNQFGKIRCGDNGIFKGVPISAEVQDLSGIAHIMYNEFKSDGKYIYQKGRDKLIICQSNAKKDDIEKIVYAKEMIINPLGYWTGGIDVDTGATNRKLGSDMGEAVTGGGLHGKDLSKADVAVNIYAHLEAQRTGEVIELYCAIGDEVVDGKDYSEIVEVAREYISKIGGFEKLAEWGLV